MSFRKTILKVAAFGNTIIGAHAFFKCLEMDHIEVKAQIEVEKYAFYRAPIKSISGSENITKFGEYSFSETLIKQITFG